MLKKPKKCSGMGDYNCQVYMPINRRVQGIDICISDIVADLVAANIITTSSCCGHNKITGMIRLEDGRILEIHYENKKLKSWRKE